MDDLCKAFCRTCNGETFQKKVVKPIGPHYGEQLCVACNTRTKFLSKPANTSKRKKNKHTPLSLGINHCQVCLRSKENLVNYEVLEVHHVVQIKDGGEDAPENIWVACTPCHKMIHFHRYYLRRKDGNYATGEQYGQVDI